ncbi:hypothetical protein J1614_012174 [Plenodomus biglobosus]|nr:hypothetical protein J1614_012174 [Plenodomus biglobosus]
MEGSARATGDTASASFAKEVQYYTTRFPDGTKYSGLNDTDICTALGLTRSDLNEVKADLKTIITVHLNGSVHFKGQDAMASKQRAVQVVRQHTANPTVWSKAPTTCVDGIICALLGRLSTNMNAASRLSSLASKRKREGSEGDNKNDGGGPVGKRATSSRPGAVANNPPTGLSTSSNPFPSNHVQDTNAHIRPSGPRAADLASLGTTSHFTPVVDDGSHDTRERISSSPWAANSWSFGTYNLNLLISIIRPEAGGFVETHPVALRFYVDGNEPSWDKIWEGIEEEGLHQPSDPRRLYLSPQRYEASPITRAAVWRSALSTMGAEVPLAWVSLTGPYHPPTAPSSTILPPPAPTAEQAPAPSAMLPPPSTAEQIPAPTAILPPPSTAEQAPAPSAILPPPSTAEQAPAPSAILPPPSTAEQAPAPSAILPPPSTAEQIPAPTATQTTDTSQVGDVSQAMRALSVDPNSVAQSIEQPDDTKMEDVQEEPFNGPSVQSPLPTQQQHYESNMDGVEHTLPSSVGSSPLSPCHDRSPSRLLGSKELQNGTLPVKTSSQSGPKNSSSWSSTDTSGDSNIGKDEDDRDDESGDSYKDLSDVDSSNESDHASEFPAPALDEELQDIVNGEAKTGDGEAKTGDGEAKTGDGEAKTGDGEAKTGDDNDEETRDDNDEETRVDDEETRDDNDEETRVDDEVIPISDDIDDDEMAMRDPEMRELRAKQVANALSSHYMQFATSTAPGSEEQNVPARGLQFISSALAAKLGRVTSEELKLAGSLLPAFDMQVVEQGGSVSLAPWGLHESKYLYGYQLLFAAMSFRQDRSILRGGINGDAPGSGKTIQGLAYALINVIHCRNYVEVTKEWAQPRDGSSTPIPRHLPKDADRSTHTNCPVQSEQGIACWCVPWHRAELFLDIPPRPGVALIVAPPAALSSWRETVKNLFQDAPILRDPHWSVRVPIQWSTPESASLIAPLSQEEINAIALDPNWSDITAWEEEQATREVNKSLRRGRWNTVYKGVVPRNKRSVPRSDRPALGSRQATKWEANRYIIITSNQCMVKRVEELFKAHRFSTWSSTETKVKFTHTWPETNTLPIARIWYDEFHLIHQGTVRLQFTKRFDNLYRQRYGHPMCIWGASGTPNSSHPLQALQFAVEYLRLDTWEEDDPTLRRLTTTRINELLTEHRALKVWFDNRDSEKYHMISKLKEGRKSIVAFLERYLPRFVIRRDLRTRWYNGYPVIDYHTTLKVLVETCKPGREEAAIIDRLESSVRSEVERRYREDMLEWEAVGRARGNPKPIRKLLFESQSYITARVAQNIAPLVHHLTKGGKEEYKFVHDNPKLEAMVKDPMSPAVAKLVAKCDLENCAKYRSLVTHLDAVKVGRRIDGSPQKCLVVLDDILTTAIYSYQLRQRYNTQAVVLYTSARTDVQKKEAEGNFNSDPTAWIMVATRKSMGVGINLQIASHLFAIDTLSKGSDYIQLFARIYRGGQTEPFVHAVVLVNAASVIEQRLLAAFMRETGLVQPEQKEHVISISDDESSEDEDIEQKRRRRRQEEEV